MTLLVALRSTFSQRCREVRRGGGLQAQGLSLAALESSSSKTKRGGCLTPEMSVTTPRRRHRRLLPPDSAASVHLSSLLADSVTVPPGPLDLYFLRGIGGWAPDVGLGCCCLLT